MTDSPETPLPEPYRIKMVEPITLHSPATRRRLLEAAGWNPFSLRAADVFIDLLTDSGTGAMSAAQWGALMQGDESYAGAVSFHDLAAAVRDVLGFDSFFPVHQGRAAEQVLFTTLVKEGDVVPSNQHFDTTRGNLIARGAKPLDLACRAAYDPAVDEPFKGDMDLSRLAEVLASGANVPLVMMTITNNSGGGQPVSMSNLRKVSEICHDHRVPFFLDACRFAENAWFIQKREPGMAKVPVAEIVRMTFDLADGFTFSAKKDGLTNIGGLLGIRDLGVLERCKQRLLLTEGFVTYGGMAGRDLAALAVGLREVVKEEYLAHRVGQVERLHRRLAASGVPLVHPAGGHAVYIDAGRLLPHIPAEAFPGHALACALYLDGGIRACEIGSLMFGDGGEKEAPKPRHATHNGGGPASTPKRLELTRLAIPRRVYTASHLDYVATVCEGIADRAATLDGFKVVEGSGPMRHFSARLEPLARTVRTAKAATH